MALPIELTNLRAIVTGASSGIGAGIALALARAGCDIACCGLDDPHSAGVQQVIAQISAQRRQAFYKQADLADSIAARAFVDWAAEQLGGVEIVASNAGRNVFRGVAATSDADWQANIDLNLAAHWRVAQAAKPYLDQAAHPVVIVTTSNHAYRTMPGCFPYNVAKAGITALVQSMAIEWGPHVRAVGIAPGFIDTPLADAWFGEFPDPAAKRAQVEAIHSAGRLGTPADIGALVAFLASPLAGFITGTTILIDGGRSAVMQDV